MSIVLTYFLKKRMNKIKDNADSNLSLSRKCAQNRIHSYVVRYHFAAMFTNRLSSAIYQIISKRCYF